MGVPALWAGALGALTSSSTGSKYAQCHKFEKLAEGRLRMLLKVGLAPDLYTWIGGFFGECQVVGPRELRETMRKLHLEGAEAQGGE